MKIFIPGNVPSSKNSNQWTGRFLIKSKPTQRYIKESSYHYNLLRDNFKKMFLVTQMPYRVGLYFIRGSHHRFDYINACQIVQDMMVKHGWIEDDNADYLLPVFLGYEYNKEMPGVVITLAGEGE